MASNPGSRTGGDSPADKKPARLIVPILAALVAIAFGAAFYLRGANNAQQNQDPAKAPVSADAGDDGAQSDPQGTPPPPPTTTQPVAAEPPSGVDESPETQPVTPTPPTTALTSITPTAAPAERPEKAIIGSTEPESGFLLQLEIMPQGAALHQLSFSGYKQTVSEDSPPLVLAEPLKVGGPGSPNATLPHFAARQITVNGKALSPAGNPQGVQSLATLSWHLADSSPSHATYTLDIVNADAEESEASGTPLLRITRTYRIEPGTYDVSLEQKIDNLSGQALDVRFSQFAMGDLEKDRGAYLGDRRLFAFGYTNPVNDPRQVRIWTDDSFQLRASVADDFAMPVDQRKASRKSIWPSDELDDDVRAQAKLAWLASENRYFSVVVHAPIPQGASKPADVVPLTDVFSEIDTFVLPDEVSQPDLKVDQRAVLFGMHTPSMNIPAGGSQDLSLAFFAGPRTSDLLAEAPYSLLNLGELVRYEIPGPCTFCTFQWLAHGLLWYLELVHNVLADWGLAIILLVVTVRLILHPITKRAQVNMMKMGKQMQALQPEMEKLKAKYGDDKQELNKAMMQLYREKGVNPANVLGCLPMLLQTPIWIALYAMLYFAIELRQEPAFYGLFQMISGGVWPFLADLSVPDRFIPILDEPAYFRFPLIPLQFDYSSINILPLLMGVTFFINAKFTSPPPANEQQAQQQKIMKFVTLLFPNFLYAAPAGLTLYIFTSTLAGIVDSYLVRKHVREQEEAGTLFDKKPKKPRKPGGFMDRMATAREMQKAKLEQMIAEKQAQQGGGKGGARKPGSGRSNRGGRDDRGGPPPPGGPPRPPKRKR